MEEEAVEELIGPTESSRLTTSLRRLAYILPTSARKTHRSLRQEEPKTLQERTGHTEAALRPQSSLGRVQSSSKEVLQ